MAATKTQGFSDAEKAAAKERVKELKRGQDRETGRLDSTPAYSTTVTAAFVPP